ncbi:MAG: hypothetical protein O3B42_00860 [Actinomycetota bacterium]|nr:hypothetical protein [Actinomycetota bacterium]
MPRSSLHKIREMTETIKDLDFDIDQARAELGMLTHIDDDTQRDAAVSEHAEDRQAARMTASDVARLQRHIQQLTASRSKVVAKRAKAVDKLAAG